MVIKLAVIMPLCDFDVKNIRPHQQESLKAASDNAAVTLWRDRLNQPNPVFC
jgi:hypothetical protein